MLVKTLCISVDPYLRIKLYPKDNVPPEEEGGEFAPFKLNEPLSSMFVGEVVSVGAGVTSFKPGDRVSGVGPWARFAALEAAALQPVPSDVSNACVDWIDLSAGWLILPVQPRPPTQIQLPPSAYLNVLGLIGLSTYFPLVEIGEPKAGETVFVSGGAGAVGSLVGQLCKAFGCKVIGAWCGGGLWCRVCWFVSLQSTIQYPHPPKHEPHHTTQPPPARTTRWRPCAGWVLTRCSTTRPRTWQRLWTRRRRGG